MKLCEVIDANWLIEIRCEDCGTRTPLDPSFFARRRGADFPLEDLHHHLVCPGCGSAQFEVRPMSPAPSGFENDASRLR